jgi:hypothetical protein
MNFAINFTYAPVLASSQAILAPILPLIRSTCRWLTSTPVPQPMQRLELRQRSLIATRGIGYLTPIEQMEKASGKPPAKTATNTSTGALSLPVLRVVRMHEAGQSQSSVGRMVMSGRMADVCAELDRLVSLET